MAGKLYLVGTPIGNLKDITYRAIETLKQVDVIACEDTRHSLVLLSHYGIKKPLLSLHKFNEKKQSEKVVELLKQGKSVAYISDAGMPCISDPGFLLLQQTKQHNLEFEIIGGITAFSVALVGCGLTTERFCFLGFLPEKNKEKELLVKNFENIDGTLIFYSSSHNINDDLVFLNKCLGSRKVVVANELTKKFEKFIEGTLGELTIKEPKGEYVVLVEGVTPKSPLNELSLEEHLKFYLEQGQTKMEAIKSVASDRKLKKDEVYKHFIK